jgi:hypothetical protein
MYRAIYCSVHVLSQTVPSGAEYKEKNGKLVLRQLQANRCWKIDHVSNFERFLNRKRLSNVPRFFALDLEGHLCKKPSLVEQAAAVDI